MQKKVQQMREQIPLIFPVKKSMTLGRASQRSSIQSTNSMTMTSSNIIDNQLPKAIRPSILQNQKPRIKFQQIKQNNLQQIQVLQQKMQNVSCLYSNFMFKNSKKNFIDEVKLERYRIMLQNERIQKNQLLKDVQQLKSQLAQTQKQKSTVMFAYRTLQQKIKQKQKQVRIKIKQLSNRNLNLKRDKLSVNLSNHDIVGSMTSVFMEDQLLKSRQILTSHGILNFNDEEPHSQNNLANGFNRSSKEIGKHLQKTDGIKEWEEKIRKFDQMEKQLSQLNEIKPKLYWLELTNKQLSEQKAQLSEQLAQQKSQHKTTIQELCQSRSTIQKLNNQITELTNENTRQSEACAQYRAKCEQQQKQDQLKKAIIHDLQNTKYSYLMKEQKEKQQMELLKKFTQNLQLNDQKINDFIQTTFGNNLQNQITTQNKLFKEDISYILHLIKKKQNIYNELINEYQEKHRQTQTRTFFLEKRLHLNDHFVKKIDHFIDAQILLCQALRNTQNTQQNTTSNTTKKVQLNRSSQYLNLNKFIQALQALLENYHLDKRII